MVFSPQSLGVATYTVGVTSWVYKGGPIPIETIVGPGFFDPVADMFSVGDLIYIHAQSGCCFMSVATVEQGKVMLAPLLVPAVQS